MVLSKLSVAHHDRDAVGMTYVYPVVSRRAGGVSVGINLNPNNACNWRCVYCQVPDLKAGKAPPIDLEQLQTELDTMLHDVVHGDFMATRVPEEFRRFNDVALSGNGEPTTSPQIGDVVELVGQRLAAVGRTGTVKIVLITNGSMVNKAFVKSALRALAALNGEVWFKLDAGTAEGLAAANGVAIAPEGHVERLVATASLCPTWIQTCLFGRGGQLPQADELAAYLAHLRALRARRVAVRGVLLYTLARRSLQPGGEALTPLGAEWLETFAARIAATGFEVKVSG